MGSPVLELVDVSKRFRAVQDGPELQVLRSITLRIAPGESVAVIGPSGSGKSTLLNIMGTLDRPTSGEVRLNGQDLAGMDEGRLAAVRNEAVGFVFQAHHLLPHCTAVENVLVPTLAGAQRTDQTQRARALLERVGLAERAHHFPGQLSGGERQRVAVVRALINSPKLLLADEPTGALDRAAAQELGQLLVDLNREEQVTLVVVTHALDLADRMGRRLELRDGQLV